MKPPSRNPSSRELRIFAALFLVFFMLFASLAWYRGSTRTAGVLSAAGGLVGAAGLLSPAMVKPVFIVWTSVTYPIGLIVTRLLMTAVFYLVVTPVGLFQRLAGADVMGRRLDRSAASYWEERKAGGGLSRYFRQY